MLTREQPRLPLKKKSEWNWIWMERSNWLMRSEVPNCDVAGCTPLTSGLGQVPAACPPPSAPAGFLHLTNFSKKWSLVPTPSSERTYGRQPWLSQRPPQYRHL